jgi:hypothetical protein
LICVNAQTHIRTKVFAEVKRTELKVTEAQASAWNALRTHCETNAQKPGEVRASMMAQHAGQQQASTLADRLDRKTVAACRW